MNFTSCLQQSRRGVLNIQSLALLARKIARNVFYFHDVPASGKEDGKCYARVFWRMLFEVRSARADETGVMEKRLCLLDGWLTYWTAG